MSERCVRLRPLLRVKAADGNRENISKNNLPFALGIDAFNRARRTLSDRSSTGNDNTGLNSMIENVMDRIDHGMKHTSDGKEEMLMVKTIDAKILDRASDTLSKAPEQFGRDVPELDAAAEDKDREVLTTELNRNYKSHPAITSTALAHTLWASVVRPGGDVVIDATSGNGHDTVHLASLLFRSSDSSSNTAATSHLYALDIQPEACDTTQEALEKAGFWNANRESISILCQSHATLPNAQSDVGLVVYNLGYCPGRDHTIQTDSIATLQSLQHVRQHVRIGGMVSIMTYPSARPSESEIEDFLMDWLGEWKCRKHALLGVKAPILWTALRVR